MVLVPYKNGRVVPRYYHGTTQHWYCMHIGTKNKLIIQFIVLIIWMSYCSTKVTLLEH